MPYATWGGYGASKAAVDLPAAVLAVEEPGLRVWAVDPGDMETDLYAAAVPEGIGTRPGPETVVPGFLHLLDRRPASGRYVAPELTGPWSESRGRLWYESGGVLLLLREDPPHRLHCFRNAW